MNVRFLAVLLLLFTGCASQGGEREAQVLHSVLTYHPAAQVVVNKVAKLERSGEILLVVDYQSGRPVFANVFQATVRRGFSLSGVLAHNLSSRSKGEEKQVVYRDSMRHFPDEGIVVLELCVWVKNVPAPVSSIWVLFHWDHIYMWDHQEAMTPGELSYLAGKGFHKWNGSAWESANPYKELRGLFVLVGKEE